VQLRSKILATARRENLTADQVQKRFGVSRVTFYKWRGPVGRGRRGAALVAASYGGENLIEREVRNMVRQALPGIIRQEVSAALKQFTRKVRT
jgi:hypothetical protein